MNNLDPKNVEGSTELFSKQCRQIWDQTNKLNFPDEYLGIQNIVLCGMGGSAYGGYVASSLLKDQLKIPLYSNNDYSLPAFANENSLIILSSYSGTTEEVLTCANEAMQKNLKIAGITGGGALADFLGKNDYPALIFNGEFNPSGQPRLGTGYMVLGTIGILNKLGLVKVTDEEISQSIEELENIQKEIKARAKTLAEKIKEFIPVVIGAEFLSGNAHILRNQFNETAKSFSAFSLLSELNHHLMEGLKNPEDKKLFFLFISSDMYSDKLMKRVELTKEVVEKNGVKFDEYKAKNSSRISQMLEVLSFGGYLSLYLAFLYGQDPSVIPWVDYFKKRLEE